MGAVMKTQWQIYQELELIPDAVPKPKASWAAHLSKPLRQFFSNSFVRELADRHRIFLFNRCLQIRELQTIDASSAGVPQDFISLYGPEQSCAEEAVQPFEFSHRTSQSRSNFFWWIWDDV